MTVFDLKNPEGQVYAFEVENSALGRRGVCAIVQRIPGTRILKRPKLMSWLRESTFCEFELDGVVYAIEEPFGDNSRYWIGPVPTRWTPQIAIVRQTFIDFPNGRAWSRRFIAAAFIAVVAAIAWGMKWCPQRV